MNQLESSKKPNVKLLFVPIFLFYFYLAYNTPLTGDDWTWGTDRGILRLERWFENYNGRYVSNLLEILLTRIDSIRYITLAAFSCLLVYYLSKLTSYKNQTILILVSFSLILLIPANVFSQTFGWTAGYVNYVISLVLLFNFLYIVRNIFEDTPPTYNKWLTLWIILLGVTAQLVVEHVTLFAIFTASVVIIYTYYKHKRFYSLHIVYLISLIAGSIIMFSNGAYWNVISGTDSYRSINNAAAEDVGLLRKIYNAYTGDMYNYLFLENPAIILFIGIMTVILVNRFYTDSNKIHTLFKSLLQISIIGAVFYIIIFKPILGDDFFGTKTNDFEALLSILFFFCIVISVAFFIKDPKVKIKLFYYISGVVLLTAPFVFVTPYGPRGALASIVFLILIGVELFAYNAKSLSWSKNIIIKPLISTVIVLTAVYMFIFTIIGITDRERVAYLKNKVNLNEETIILSEIPFSQYLWMSSPPNKHFNKMFKRFYNVPENTEVKFIPNDKWKKEYKK